MSKKTIVTMTIIGMLFVIWLTWQREGMALADAGDIDPTFGTDGKVITHISGYDEGYGVVTQPDGKIVVAGRTMVGGWFDFAVVRYNNDGSLDNSFGSGGKVITSVSAWSDEGYTVTIQPDGKIVVAGDFFNFWTFSFCFAILRYNPDGSLDTIFGNGGIVTTSVNGYAKAVAIQPDGKIVVAGTSENFDTYADFTLLRLNSNGSLDNSFGMGGKVTVDFDKGYDWGNAVAIQQDGKIVVAGSASTGNYIDFAVARYTPDGSIDISFGSSGKVITDIGGFYDFGNAVIIQRDGKIVVAGSAELEGKGNFAVVRYNPDGSLDSKFGSHGIVITAFSSGEDHGFAVALQPNGKIVVAGSGQNGDFVAVARYNRNGKLDYSFGNFGQVITDVTDNTDWGYAVALQSDCKIVVAGASYVGYSYDFSVVRYLSDDPCN